MNTYIIYQTGFDEFNIEITYNAYEDCFNISKTINFTLDEREIYKLADMLKQLGFEEIIEEEEY